MGPEAGAGCLSPPGALREPGKILYPPLIDWILFDDVTLQYGKVQGFMTRVGRDAAINKSVKESESHVYQVFLKSTFLDIA